MKKWFAIVCSSITSTRSGRYGEKIDNDIFTLLVWAWAANELEAVGLFNRRAERVRPGQAVGGIGAQPVPSGPWTPELQESGNGLSPCIEGSPDHA